MIATNPPAFLSLWLCILVITGCANTDNLQTVVDTTIANEKLLKQHHARVSGNLQRSIDSLGTIETRLRELVPQQCRKINHSAGDLIKEKADKLEYLYHLKFEQTAERILNVEFKQRFETEYLGRLRGNYDTRRNELDRLNGLLANAKTTANAQRAVQLQQQVREKRIEVLSLVERSKSDELELRDTLYKRISEQRAAFIKQVVAETEKIRTHATIIKNRSCSLASPPNTEKKQNLETLKQELSALQHKVANLYQEQEKALQVIKDYVNTISVFKLVLIGIQEETNQEIKNASDSVAALLDKVQENADTVIASAAAKLNQTAISANDLINRGTEKLDGKLEQASTAIGNTLNKVLTK